MPRWNGSTAWPATDPQFPQIRKCSVRLMSARGFFAVPSLTAPQPGPVCQHQNLIERHTVTQAGSEPTPIPEGYEGYTPPRPAPDAGGQYPPVPQPQQPYQGQQQSSPAGAQQPYPAPGTQYHQPYGQMSQQPPMPNPDFGSQQPKSKLVAGLLGIFLGGLGIHRFYLGHTKIGIIQLVLSIVLSSLSFPIVALWSLIEGIMILTGSTRFRTDARGVPLRG